jgi:phage terminase small subunit
MLDKPLRNARWELFAQGVAKGASATQAYKDVGYKAEGHSAGQQASRMMTNGDIAARIEALKAKVVERVVEETGITMADIVAGLAKIAFNDAVTEGYGLDIKRKALVDIGKHLAQLAQIRPWPIGKSTA